jgi:poly(3-hydroxybutyrate) depolymerase
MPSLFPSRKLMAGRCLPLIFIIVVFANHQASAQVYDPKNQNAHVSPWGTKFLCHLPKNYVASTPVPMLLYLHGGASIGNDLSILINPTSSDKAPPQLIATGNWPADTRPFIVISPQLRRNKNIPNYNDQEWNPDSVNEVLEYVKTLYSIDANRIYLTGMSLGGAACWSYAAAYPSKVAAFVPISGKTDITQACILKDIPIWAFHGSNDNLVDPPYTIDMVNAVTACAGVYKPKLNLLNTKAHEGWNEVWNGTDGYPVFDWMLQFTKNNFTNKPAFVTAGADLRLLQRTGTTHIYGEYFDFDGSVTTAAWSQISGPAITLNTSNPSFLEFTNAPAGDYEFELRITDNLGLQSFDRMKLQIVSSVGSEAAVTDLVLMNGGTNANIGNLSDGYIINKTTLGTTQFNVNALATGGAVSVIFRVNGDQNVRIPGSPFLIRKQVSSPEWVIANGDYNICATPYTQNAGKGLPGISQCFKVTVTDQVVVIKTFYSKPGTDISSLSNWGTNTDGSGTSPLSFATAEQSFIINNTCTLGSPLTISGTNSNLTVKGTGTLTINAAFTGTLNAETTAVVNINTSQPITFGSISSNTQLNFQQNATQIPFAEYGNIRLMGSGSTKTLASDSTFVINNMTIDAGVTLNGAADNSSVLALASNFNINESGVFNPTTKFNLYLKSQTGQQLIFRTTQANFSNIEIAENSNVQVVNPVTANTTTLVLGSTTGGGLTLNTGAHLYLDKHSISIIGKGSINSLNENGQLGFKKSNLSITSQTNSHSYLYPVASQDSLKTLSVNLTGTGALYLQQKLYLTDSVKVSSGTIHSNGNLTLVSTSTSNARIGRLAGTGKVEGAIEFQRYLQKERLYKYITFPLSGLKVDDIQTTIPVTGTFTGASTGAGLSSNPSMYLYNEPLTWLAYPQVANTDTLQVGRGYSVFVRNDASDSKLILHGKIRQGDFTFNLTANPSVDPDKGWNLIGNPYPSSIKWQASGWNFSGLNNAVYVRDNSYPGGKFFVWDGTTGDAAFGGVIPQGQAFWVRTINASPSLTIHETAKTSLGNGTLFRVADDNEAQHNLALELRHGNLSDKTYISLRSNAVNRFEELTDAVKQKNGFFNISTLSSDSVVLAINNLSTADCSHAVNLVLEATEPGDYIFECSGSLYNDNLKSVSLHDNYLDSTITMKLNDIYKFNINNEPLSKSINRFQLSIVTDVPQPQINVTNGILYSNIDEGNQWLLNGEPIEGAVNSSYRPMKTGNYSLVVSNGCTRSSASVPFIVTGEDKYPVSADDIMLYPNPAKSILHLKTDRNVTTATTYNIIDLLGRKIQSGAITGNDFKQGTDIQLSDSVTTGFHVLVLTNSQFNVRLTFLKQ